MDNPPMMTLEDLRSSALQDAPRMTFSGELSISDSTIALNQTLKNTSNSLSIVDDPLEDQTKLELKNKSSLEREINQTLPSQISKDGSCLQISNHLTKEKTKTYFKSTSDSISSPNLELNGMCHDSHLPLDSHFLTTSGSSMTNNVDIDSSNSSSTSYPFSSLKIRSISDPTSSFESSPVGPCHLEHPYSAPFPVSKGSDLPRIIKHKPSSITFADYSDFLGLMQNSRATESSDAFETSSEDEGQDVVFHDDGNEALPKCKDHLSCSRRNRGGLEKLRRKGTCGQGVGEERSRSNPPLTSSSSYEAEEESSSTEVRMR